MKQKRTDQVLENTKKINETFDEKIVARGNPIMTKCIEDKYKAYGLGLIYLLNKDNFNRFGIIVHFRQGEYLKCNSYINNGRVNFIAVVNDKSLKQGEVYFWNKQTLIDKGLIIDRGHNKIRALIFDKSGAISKEAKKHMLNFENIIEWALNRKVNCS